MPGEAIKVAVRVRPFNDREQARNAVQIIEMPDKQRTTIKDPKNMNAEPKSFAFDHSYWSHDDFKENGEGYNEATGSKYADQRQVYNDLGQGVLDNAWKGYNCSLFAYGQTGSGKSYSMVGYGTNKGIIPIACDELFKMIAQKADGNMEYQVAVSMFEIYCEKVRDLLSSKAPPKGGLKVREHPKKGFYVDDLRECPVSDYAAIEAKMDEGNKSRTIAATNMNATSSRAHTIVKINFTQKDKSANTTKTSVINLVDLAGSERQADTGATGDRMKEGIVINQSLSTLGRVIKALHDAQTSKGKKVNIPYRDSVLTSLLKNALGGNSKTVMIAALSPADINYDETLSTLRFADRAKSIKTSATVNESATDRLIRELKEENAKLQSMVKGGGGGGGGGGGEDDDEEMQRLKAELEANRIAMENMETSWKERLQQEAVESKVENQEHAEAAKKRQTMAHFWNLNEDPALSDMVVHFVKTGECRVGSNKAAKQPDIVLAGMSISNEHCVLKNKDHKKVTMTAMPQVSILVNGKEIQKETQLNHNDRVLFGGNHLYVFSNPNAKKKEKKQTVTWEQAQEEIAQNSGILGKQGGHGRSKEDMILQEELVQIMPQVYRANAMSDELKKPTRFEIVLVSPQARGLKGGQTEIEVKAVNKHEDTEFLWDKNKFINRYYGMQELYQNYNEGYADWDVSKDQDPFYESPDAEMLIGGVHMYLRSLAYMIELDDQLPITDFKGQERGQLIVSAVPCTPQGKEITDGFVDSPEDLVGKNLSFKIKVKEAVGLPRQFVTSRCKYKFYMVDDYAFTKEVDTNGAKYNHDEKFQFKPVTKQLVEYLQEDALYIEVLGKQAARGDAGRRGNLPTYNQGATGSAGGGNALESKLDNIQKLLDDAAANKSKNISVKDIQKAMSASERAKSARTTGGDKLGPGKGNKKRGSVSSKSNDSGFSDNDNGGGKSGRGSSARRKSHSQSRRNSSRH